MAANIQHAGCHGSPYQYHLMHKSKPQRLPYFHVRIFSFVNR